jgi:hypothetical protein
MSDKATAGKPLAVAHLSWPGALNSLLAKNIFFLLSTYFCTCGQLLLISYTTCLPCPNFS